VLTAPLEMRRALDISAGVAIDFHANGDFGNAGCIPGHVFLLVATMRNTTPVKRVRKKFVARKCISGICPSYEVICGKKSYARLCVGKNRQRRATPVARCRMGNDSETSVIDKYHRAHDVPNLFIVDNSCFVTGGRNHPTLTTSALAFRAANYLIKAAKAAM
jgi:choline dehydrogenase-like flavoprotein